MKVLVACEESQEVCKAFRKLGHEAYSCDTQKSSGNRPEWHIQEDVLKLITKGGKTIYTQDGSIGWIDSWDLLIAHPPCTYLSKAGACRLYKTAGIVDKERLALGMEAKEFFLKLLNANIPQIVIENPTPLRIYELPKPSQIIQPYMFGHPFSKRTLLWLKGLPELKPTQVIEKYTTYLPSNTGGKKRGQMARTDKEKPRDAKIASKTFTGIAKAMAQQWGSDKLSEYQNILSEVSADSSQG